MSGRPRLVHEGSPIMGDGDSIFPSSAAATTTTSQSHGGAKTQINNGKNQHVVGSNLASLASTKATSTKTKSYKLQTRLVVGDIEDTHNSDDDLDLDMMAMDEDDHDHNHTQQGSSGAPLEDYSTSQYYGTHGHVYHGHHAQHQQHGVDHVGFESSTQQQNVQTHQMGKDEHDHGHNQQGSTSGALGDYSTSQYYGSHGHVYHGHHALPQQHCVGPMGFASSTQQQNLHSHQHQHNGNHVNGFYNNGNSFASADEDNHLPSNPPPSIYQMPSPSTSPLVVLDAANIAYNYSESLNPCQGSQRRQPDPRGIRLAIEYFLKQNCRVQAVVPISWYQLKPRPADHYHLQNRSRGDSDAKMVTDEVEELRSLRQQGFLVACPPGDDDDAYALALARREDDRLLEQSGIEHPPDVSMGMDDDTTSLQQLPKSVLGGYVVSNDMFADAIRRDAKKQHHHQHPLNMRPLSLKTWLKSKRISYSFANVGTTSHTDGEIRLDFLPNPRNDLIEAIDACNRLKCGMKARC